MSVFFFILFIPFALFLYILTADSLQLREICCISSLILSQYLSSESTSKDMLHLQIYYFVMEKKLAFHCVLDYKPSSSKHPPLNELRAHPVEECGVYSRIIRNKLSGTT